MAKFENFAGKLLRLEGGYVNHPLDRGGPTKYGVILSVWQEHGHDKDGDGVTVPGLGTKFAIGFYCSIATTAFGFADYSNVDHNHFKGELDNIKIYHIAKSASEVLAQYDAEKP